MPRRQHVTLLTFVGIAAILCVFFVSAFRSQPEGTRHPDYVPGYQGNMDAGFKVDQGVLFGEATAPKLENKTVKAELGRATWKLLHTMMAKFPDKPTEEDSEALRTYIHLFARLYPCGDCARHFQKLLKKFPPQVASRSTAAAWACVVHNEVNKKVHKELFDCSKIGDFYDCGCADDGKGEGKYDDGFKKLQLEKEGLTRGG